MPSELVCTRPLGQLLLTSSSTASVLSHRLSAPASDALRCEPPATVPSAPRSLWVACRAWRFFCSDVLPGGTESEQRVPRRAVFRCAAPRGAQRCPAVWFRSFLVQCGVWRCLPEGLLSLRAASEDIARRVPGVPSAGSPSPACLWSEATAVLQRASWLLRRPWGLPFWRLIPARPTGRYRWVCDVKERLRSKPIRLSPRPPPTHQQRHRLYMHTPCQLLDDG